MHCHALCRYERVNLCRLKSLLSKTNLALIAALFFAISANAQVFTEEKKVLLTSELREKWTQRFFETDEIWRFQSRAGYERFVNSLELDDGLKHELRVLYQDALTTAQKNKNAGFYHIKGAGGYAVIPNAIREKLPREVMAKAHVYAWKNYGTTPKLSMKFKSAEELKAVLGSKKFDGSDRKRLMQNVIKLEDDYILVISPSIWSELPQSMKEWEVIKSVSTDVAGIGLKVEVEVAAEEVSAVAKKYAGERNPDALERYLRRLLRERKTAWVPLQKLAPPFVRKMIDQRAECHGPNCFNAGLNVNRGKRYQVAFTDEAPLIQEAYSNYRFVKPDEAMQMGDLLMYRNERGRLIHVSSYMGDGIVFTKNGFNRANPYVFQTMLANEKVYFPNGDFNLVVMRMPEAAEQVARTGKQAVQEVFYRQNVATVVRNVSDPCAPRFLNDLFGSP